MHQRTTLHQGIRSLTPFSAQLKINSSNSSIIINNTTKVSEETAILISCYVASDGSTKPHPRSPVRPFKLPWFSKKPYLTYMDIDLLHLLPNSYSTRITWNNQNYTSSRKKVILSLLKRPWTVYTTIMGHQLYPDLVKSQCLSRRYKYTLSTNLDSFGFLSNTSQFHQTQNQLTEPKTQ